MERGEGGCEGSVGGGVPSALLGSGCQGADECDLSQFFSPERYTLVVPSLIIR